MSMEAISAATSSGMLANTTTALTMSGWAVTAMVATASILVFLISLAAIVFITGRKENPDRFFDRLPVRRRSLKSLGPQLDKDLFLQSSVGVSYALKESFRWAELYVIGQKCDDLFWLAGRIQYFIDYYQENPSGLLQEEKQQMKGHKPIQQGIHRELDEEVFLNFFTSYYDQVPQHLKSREGIDIIFSHIPVIIQDHRLHGSFPFKSIQGVDLKEEFTLSHLRVLFAQLPCIRNQLSRGENVRINADLDGFTPPEDRRQKIHVFGSFHENKERYKQLQSLAKKDDRVHFLWYYALAIEVHQSKRLDLEYFADESKQTLSELKSVLTAFISDHRESSHEGRSGLVARSVCAQGKQRESGHVVWYGEGMGREVVSNVNSARSCELLGANGDRSFPFDISISSAEDEVFSDDETVEWWAERS